MNYDRTKRLISEVKSNRHTEFSHAFSGIGEIVKKKRVELNLTQESFSTGICSVSYLSKVENNRMNPNTYFVEEMSKKCGINLQLCSDEFEDSTVLKLAFKAFYQNDLPLLEILTKRALDLELKRTYHLCLLALNVSRRDYKASRHVIGELEQSMGTFDPAMLAVFGTLCVIHAFQTNAYVEALTLLNAMDNKSDTDPRVTVLNDMYGFLIKQKLQRKTESIRHYTAAMNNLNKYHQTDYLTMLKLYHINFLIGEAPKEALSEFDKLSPKRISVELINMYQYLKMRLIPKGTLTIESIKMLDDTNKDCWFYRALLLVAPKNIDNIKHFFKYTTEDSLLEKVYFQSLVYDNEQDYKRYLKDICLPLAIEKQEMDYIDFFSKKLITLSCDNARYKEALAIYTKKNKALSRMITQIEN